jgi:hypothetical protein
LVAFLLRTRLAALNHRKDVILSVMPEGEKQELSDLREFEDSDPRFRYMT